MKQGECFKCKEPVMVEKVGEWPGGKPKWRTFEMDGVTEHPHSPTKVGNAKPNSGGSSEIMTKLSTIETKIDQLYQILRGQSTFNGNE